MKKRNKFKGLVNTLPKATNALPRVVCYVLDRNLLRWLRAHNVITM